MQTLFSQGLNYDWCDYVIDYDSFIQSIFISNPLGLGIYFSETLNYLPNHSPSHQPQSMIGGGLLGFTKSWFEKIFSWQKPLDMTLYS
jgi:hypothetical protein